MLIDPLVRINAREGDVFDLFNLRHYVGPNPYLDTAALTFDFALNGDIAPLPLAEYEHVLRQRLPGLPTCQSYPQLFAEAAALVNGLDMDLPLRQYRVHAFGRFDRIALQTLHSRTTRSVLFFVWDWLEAIQQRQMFDYDGQMRKLQEIFRISAYGGPTVYALYQAAQQQQIPAFYLWDEHLMQYGFGKHQVRGVATSFASDSNLDSDFTTHKDDCKIFLDNMGLPVPVGGVVQTLEAAQALAVELGFPLAIKPVSGHKGIGVTANVQSDEEVEFAFEKALEAIPDNVPKDVIVEQSIQGNDFRLLCVAGKFVAAVERQPPWVVGNGFSTILSLIAQENAKPERLDTPTSPLGKIPCDESLAMCLAEQGLSVASVPRPGERVYVRKVANLSSGGVSIDATQQVHPDTIMLAQDIAQHFRLTCLGIDVIAADISQSWRQGNFGIIEINAAPGIYMHLKPAIGESVDVPSQILQTFFATPKDARIPIVTVNYTDVASLQALIDTVLFRHPGWTVGGVCWDALFINRVEKFMHPSYNQNILNLLRNPKLDVLIAEYSHRTLERSGMFYEGSDLVILDNPTERERLLARQVVPGGTVITCEGQQVSVQSQGMVERYIMQPREAFSHIYLREIARVLE
ncbi:MAG: cyanophycin synthetase [Synechococcaceae cyanobacterium SM2_3_60]|nr:cyanophycin synthetase [Synechococcaceae cyanobacterium SM2_3_60]